jgi:hypothetical protein
MPSTKPDMIMGSKKEIEGKRFWYCNLSAYRSTAHRVFIWTVHLCVLVYVIVAVMFWKSKGEEI